MTTDSGNTARLLSRPAFALLGLFVAVATGCSVTGQSIGGDVAHGRDIARTRCAACHGAEGNRTRSAAPRLAGQRAGYMYRQLVDFRSGARPSSVMQAIVSPLPASAWRDVVSYYAAQEPSPDPSGPPTLMAEGRRIFHYGTADRGVPACAACHAPGAGSRGGGMMGMGGMHRMGMMGGTNAPTLYTQHAAYVVGQLQAFADGRRPSTVMGGIAGRMTEAQARAVAAYVAAHP